MLLGAAKISKQTISQIIIWIKDQKEETISGHFVTWNPSTTQISQSKIQQDMQRNVWMKKKKMILRPKEKKKKQIILLGPCDREGKGSTEDMSWRYPRNKLFSKVWLQSKRRILNWYLSREQPILGQFSGGSCSADLGILNLTVFPFLDSEQN